MTNLIFYKKYKYVYIPVYITLYLFSNMARRRYRRYRRRSGRWSPNLNNFRSYETITGNGDFANTITLAQNPYQSSSGVNQTFTVKNIELTANFETSSEAAQYLENLTVYIMYVPQGMTITTGYPRDHPEYIMAYKYLGSPSPDINQGYQPTRIKSRLSRKLQSGDSIHLVYTLTSEAISGSVSVPFNVNGLVRWWTKAN